MNSDQHFALVLVGIFGVLLPVLLAIGIPAGKAWARRLEGRAQPDPRLLDELDGLRQRVGELEERLDFTERVLAAKREPHLLSEGHE